MLFLLAMGWGAFSVAAGFWLGVKAGRLGVAPRSFVRVPAGASLELRMKGDVEVLEGFAEVAGSLTIHRE